MSWLSLSLLLVLMLGCIGSAAVSIQKTLRQSVLEQLKGPVGCAGIPCYTDDPCCQGYACGMGLLGGETAYVCKPCVNDNCSSDKPCCDNLMCTGSKCVKRTCLPMPNSAQVQYYLNKMNPIATQCGKAFTIAAMIVPTQRMSKINKAIKIMKWFGDDIIKFVDDLQKMVLKKPLSYLINIIPNPYKTAVNVFLSTLKAFLKFAQKFIKDYNKLLTGLKIVDKVIGKLKLILTQTGAALTKEGQIEKDAYLAEKIIGGCVNKTNTCLDNGKLEQVNTKLLPYVADRYSVLTMCEDVGKTVKDFLTKLDNLISQFVSDELEKLANALAPITDYLKKIFDEIQKKLGEAYCCGTPFGAQVAINTFQFVVDLATCPIQGLVDTAQKLIVDVLSLVTSKIYEKVKTYLEPMLTIARTFQVPNVTVLPAKYDLATCSLSPPTILVTNYFTPLQEFADTDFFVTTPAKITFDPAGAIKKACDEALKGSNKLLEDCCKGYFPLADGETCDITGLTPYRHCTQCVSNELSEGVLSALCGPQQCMKEAGVCSKYKCCEGENLKCQGGLCIKTCHEVAGICGPNSGSECCGNLKCRNGFCGESCIREAGSCLNFGNDCCGDLICQGGLCVQPCHNRGGICGPNSGSKCCGDLKCRNGLCGDSCLGKGGACLGFPGDCCSGLTCQAGICMPPCHNVNGICGPNSGSTCCGGLKCRNGFCGNSCIAEAGSCLNYENDCCGDLICQAGLCVQPCHNIGGICGPNSGSKCCGDLKCRNGLCGDSCVAEAGSCINYENDCCGELICQGGLCVQPCHETAGICGPNSGSKCCGDLKCRNGFCGGSCIAEAGSCLGYENDCCGDLICQAGLCVQPCHKTAGICGPYSGSKCCDGYVCNNGFCGPTCADEGLACSSSSDCCGSLVCKWGTCTDCWNVNHCCDAAACSKNCCFGYSRDTNCNWKGLYSCDNPH